MQFFCPRQLIDLYESNFEYLFWFIPLHMPACRKTTTNIRYSKFDMSKSMSCWGHLIHHICLIWHPILNFEVLILCWQDYSTICGNSVFVVLWLALENLLLKLVYPVPIVLMVLSDISEDFLKLDIELISLPMLN